MWYYFAKITTYLTTGKHVTAFCTNLRSFLMKQGENVCGTTKYEVKEAK